MKLDKLKQQELDSAYDTLIQVCLYDQPLKDMEPLLADDVMNFGAGKSELTTSKQAFLTQIGNQKKLAAGLKMDFEITPVLRKITNEGLGAIYTDDIINTVWIDGVENSLKFRLSFIFEYRDNKWIMLHSHTSAPDSQRNDNEVWPLEELKKRTAFLEKSLDEKIAELEIKNRELEIEAALEKVRSRTMGMQRSDELQDAAMLLFQQVEGLGIHAFGCGFNIWDEDRKFATAWMAGKDRFQPPFKTSSTDDIFLRIYGAADKGEPLFVEEQKGKELQNHYKYLASIPEFKDIMDKMAEADLSVPSVQVMHCAFFSQGYLMFITFEPIATAHDIFKRFAMVFQQTYTRFLDLQMAEAQAREAMVEASLERVRARSMAMHKSEELQDVIITVFQQLQLLGIKMDSSHLQIYDDSKDFNLWIAVPQNNYVERMHFPYFDHPIFNNYLDGIASGKKFISDVYNKKEKDVLFKQFFANSDLKSASDERKKYIFECAGYARSLAYGSHAAISYVNYRGEPYSDEENEILVRFANVFDQTYTRFSDLKSTEAQARKALIEVALERVRARSMAMHQSDELKDVIKVIFDQMTQLNINAEHAGIVVDYEPMKDFHFWVAETQDIPSRITVPYLDLVWDRQFTEAKKKGMDFFMTQLDFEEKNRFYKVLLPHIQGLTKKAQDFYFSCPGLSISTVIEKDIGLYIENFSGTPYTDEENNILKRFGKVFQQTYTRFLDLQKAEAQAREAQIETALEKVRSRTMAMQKGEELKEVVVLLYKELMALGVSNFVTCGYVEINEKINRQFTWVTSPGGDSLGLFYLPLTGDATFDERYAAWKQQQIIFHQKVAGEVRSKHLEYAITTFNSKEAEEMVLGQFPDPCVFYCFNFSHGYLHLVTGSKLKNEEELLLARFTRVFEQTYARFLDLQKSEAQAREAQIEAALERARAQSMMMQHSSELYRTTDVFHEQLQILGINSEFSYLWLPDEDKMEHLFWATWQEDQKKSSVLKNKQVVYPLDKSDPAIAECYVVWDSGAPVHVNPVQPADVEDYFATWSELLDGVNKFKPELYPDGLYYVDAYMKYGCFGIMIRTPLSESEQVILQRFSKEFERAYTRFLDLQKAEAQAREALIEAALEIVRSRSLAMHTTNELGEVVAVIVEKLSDLGVVLDANGVVLCTYFQESKDVLHWMASPDFTIAGSYLLPYFDHPIFNDAWQSKESGTEYFSKAYSVKEKDSFFKYAFEHSDYKHFPDEFKEWIFQNDKHILSFAWQKNSAILIPSHTGVLPTEDDQSILIRFAKVFEQAYVRFMDLKKAETQAREAQIEVSLERVRAKTMAMHKSEDLAAAITTVFSELEDLGFRTIRCGIGIFNDTSKKVNVWTASDGGKNKTAQLSGDEMLEGHPLLDGIYSSYKKQQDYSYVLNGEDLHNYYKVAADSNLPVSGPKEKVEQATQYYHCVMFPAGGLFAFREGSFSEEARSLMRRFADVFHLAFIRHLDLMQAEAQTREAQIEAAMERVRSKAMAMHSSEDLGLTVDTFFAELNGLNISPHRCGVGIVEGETRVVSIQAIDTNSKKEAKKTIGNLKLSGHPVLDKVFESWELQQEYFPVLRGKEIADYYEVMNPQVAFHEFADDEVQYGYYFYFKEGGVYAWTDTELQEQDIQIFRRYTSVLSLTYRRYMDLKDAEAKAREARIEAALEKVRSRTMAMQHSDELPDAANVLFLEVQSLGINAWSAGYNILAEDKKSSQCVMSSEGLVQIPFMLPFTGEKSFREWFKAIKSGVDFYTQKLKGKAIKEHYKYLLTLPGVGKTIDQIEDAGFPLPSHQINHLSFFSQGFLLFITYEQVPEAWDIFKRFTRVFEQTYTRFLDLKHAEEQAQKAKIETALERVRARALAMQQPEELKDVADVLRKEMGKLGIEELETCSIYINDESAERAECWYAIKDIREDKKTLINDYFALNLNDTWVGRKMLKFYQSEKQQVSILMTGEPRVEWIRYCEEKSVPLRGYYGDVIPDRTYHLYKFSHGAIGAATAGDISDENWGILKRAASAFSLAYSRFKDLTQARIDLMLLKEEKKRAEDALADLEEAQEQLVHAEKMASLGELTAGIAHEIQNPLNFVNNFSEVNSELIQELKDEIDGGELEEAKAIADDIAGNEEKIKHHGKRADDIVKGMLQHSRTTAGEKELTDINELADEFLRLAYHGLRAKDKAFNSDFNTELDKNLPKVKVVAQDLGRVLLNMINNAFYAVDKRAKEQAKNYRPHVSVSTFLKNHQVEIRVKDNGSGIPDQVLNKIFQPFFTTKPTGEGTGLGLSLSYDIITKGHGGELNVETKENEGTTFIILLPTETSK